MMSLGFILFKVGDGCLTENVIKFQFINIKFNNTGALVISAWVMLFWFLLRYWQESRGKAFNEFKQSAHAAAPQILLAWYITRRTRLKYMQDGGFAAPTFRYAELPHWKVIYTVAAKINKGPSGAPISFDGAHNHTLMLTGVYGGFLKLCFYIIAAFRLPAFTSYMAPYLFFITAVSLHLFWDIIKAALQGA